MFRDKKRTNYLSGMNERKKRRMISNTESIEMNEMEKKRTKRELFHVDLDATLRLS